MLRVGLTGGLATGKTTVGRLLESYGCHLIRADQLGHQVLEPGGAAVEAVTAAFGTGVRQEGGIDRKRLGEIVFHDPAALARLNAIIHPLVFQLEEREIARFAALDPPGIAVVEAAILIETGSYKRFDKLIVIVCGEDQQIQRAMARGGMTEAAARDRMALQMPGGEKRKFADYIIETSGTIEETERQTLNVFEELRSLIR